MSKTPFGVRNNRYPIPAFVFAILLLLAIGCRTGEPSSYTSDGATVIVPAGAVSSDVDISISEVKLPAPLPIEYAAAGPVFAALPHGTTFALPVTVHLPYSTHEGASLRILRLEEGEDQTWQSVDGGSFQGGLASFQTYSFCYLVVVSDATVSTPTPLPSTSSPGPDSTPSPDPSPTPPSSGQNYEGDVSGECADRADNDMDGYYDCNDSNCFGSPDCAGLASYCGDGILDPGESCEPKIMSVGVQCSEVDPRFTSGTLSCSDDCKVVQDDCIYGGICGNGSIETGEECDDANSNDDDGCSATCLSEYNDENNSSCTGSGVHSVSGVSADADDFCDNPGFRDGYYAYTPISPMRVSIKFHVTQNIWGDRADDDGDVAWVLSTALKFYKSMNVVFDWMGSDDIDVIEDDPLGPWYYNLDEDELSQIIVLNNDPTAIDVYIVNTFTGGCGASLVAPEPEWDGIVIEASCGGPTLAHELGHVLGLWHTHHFDAAHQGTTPDTQYDFCRDTPFDPGTSNSSNDGAVNTCSDPYPDCTKTPECTDAPQTEGIQENTATPDQLNVMSYYICADNPSRGYFTPNQMSRLRCYLDRDMDHALIPCSDQDGDGYGTQSNWSCIYPQIDCHDDNPMAHPNGHEVCSNSIDDDCNDGDLDCDDEDSDGDGYSPNQGDWDDEDPSSYPGAPDITDNVDNDNDGDVDEDQYDWDKDGVTVLEGDCDDYSSLVAPGLAEVPDGLDNDCDGEVDESALWQAIPGDFVMDPAPFWPIERDGNGVLHTLMYDYDSGNESLGLMYAQRGNSGWVMESVSADYTSGLAVESNGTVHMAGYYFNNGSPTTRIWRRETGQQQWSFENEIRISPRYISGAIDSHGRPVFVITSDNSNYNCTFYSSDGLTYGGIVVGGCNRSTLLIGADGTAYIFLDGPTMVVGTERNGAWSFTSPQQLIADGIGFGAGSYDVKLDPSGMYPRIVTNNGITLNFGRFDGSKWSLRQTSIPPTCQGNCGTAQVSLATLSDDSMCAFYYNGIYGDLRVTCDSSDESTTT